MKCDLNRGWLCLRVSDGTEVIPPKTPVYPAILPKNSVFWWAVIDLITHVISERTAVIDLITRVVSERTAVIDLITRVVFGRTAVIDLITRVVSGRTAVIDLITRVVSERTAVIDLITRVVSETTAPRTAGQRLFYFKKISKNIHKNRICFYLYTCLLG